MIKIDTDKKVFKLTKPKKLSSDDLMEAIAIIEKLEADQDLVAVTSERKLEIQAELNYVNISAIDSYEI